MSSRLVSLCVDAHDPAHLARFWAGVLGWEHDAADDLVLLPTDDTGFTIRFLPTEQPKTEQNQMHLDLTSASPEDQQRTVARVLELGGHHLDIGQRPEEGHVVLADPEGNELCVIGAGNAFLADCGFVGAVACDGSREVGYFWSRALDWPLVWDQDEETAIRSPYGGPKITWGGPPLRPKTARYRLRFDVVPRDGDQQAEVDRLVSLGGRAVGGPDEDGRVELTDPDGHEFSLLRPD